MNKSEIIVNRIRELIGKEIKEVQVHEPSFEKSNASSYIEDLQEPNILLQ